VILAPVHLAICLSVFPAILTSVELPIFSTVFSPVQPAIFTTIHLSVCTSIFLANIADLSHQCIVSTVPASSTMICIVPAAV
jgi:hypothetical protein